MKHTILQKLLSLALVLCLLCGIMPTTLLQGAAAMLSAQTRAVYGDPMDWLLSAEGTELTSGPWRYIVVQPQNYAVITGHDDPSATQLAIPAVLGGADVAAIGAGALSDHAALSALTIPGNVNAIARDAIPKGVTLQGYNATYAQRFASSARYPFQSLSDYDFLAGVVDYADISTSAFRRISANTMYMRELEASRLAVGSRFFLVDPANAYQISYYRVTAISAPDDAGFVRLDCQTPVLDEVMASYSGTNEVMVLDPGSLRLEEGVVLENAAQLQRGEGMTTPRLSAGFSIPIGKSGLKMGASISLQSTFYADYTGSLFVKKSLTVREHRSASFSITASLDSGNLLNKDDESNADKEDKDPAFNEELFIRDAVAQAKKAYEKHGYDQTYFEHEQRLGKGILFSYAGIASLDIVFKVSLSIKGQLKLTYTEEAEYFYYGDSDGKVRVDRIYNDKNCSVEGSAELKFGVVVELNGYLLCVCLVQGYGFAGVQVGISTALPLASDPDKASYTSPNMADCVKLDVKLVAEFGIKAGLLKVFELDAEKLGANRGISKKFELPLFEMHFHCLPYCFTPGETAGTCIYNTSKEKDNFHLAADCPYKGAKVTFLLPTSETEDLTYFESTQMEKEFAIFAPETPFEQHEDVRFLGWYATRDFQPDTEIDWPFTLTEDETVFYGNLTRSHLLTITDLAGDELTPAQYVFAGDVFALPPVDLSPVYWYVRGKSEVTGNVDLTAIDEALESGEGGYIMPEEDLTIIASPFPVVTVEFYERIDDNPPTLLDSISVLASMTITAPASSVSGLIDLGWVDNNGETVTFPYVVPTSITDSVAFVHLLSADPSHDFSDNGYGTQTGAEAFHYKKYADYVEITGYNPDRFYSGTDGGSIYLKQEAYNLVIPAYIDDLPVRSIANNAFEDIDTLRTIEFPATITRMGSYALSGCDNLRYIGMGEVQIPGLPVYFAHSCDNLVSIDLPDHEGFSYGESCLSGTSLISVTVRGDVGPDAFMSCKNLVSLTVESGCEKIDTYAFSYSGLQNVTLFEGVTSIGDYAFGSCDNLTAIAFPDSVTSYGRYILQYCYALEELTIGGGYSASSGYDHFFIGNNSALRTLTIREGVTRIPDYAFANMYSSSTRYWFPNLTTITLPASLRTIGNYAFANCGVTSLTISGVIDSIGANAFSGCDDLTSLTLKGSSCIIGSHAFSSCTNLRSLDLSGVYALSTYAFSSTGLEKAILGSGIRLIDDYAFYNCDQLKSISFSDSITTYGDYILRDCTALEELTIGGGCNAMTSKTFYIGNNSALNTITVCEGVTQLPDYAFANKDYYTYHFPNLTTVSLPESLTSIGEYAFFCSGITSLTLSGNIASIGKEAFGGSLNLASVTIDGADCVIGRAAFYSCKNLRSLSLSGVKTIGVSAFSGSGLQHVTIPEGVTSIGESAFASCKQLKSISFPDSVTSYGDYLIEGCLALEELTVGGGCNAMTLKTFYVGNNSALRKLTIREGVTKIPDHAFENYHSKGYTYYFPSLTTISLPESLTTIGAQAFYRSGVTSLTLSGNITSIGQKAFSGCGNLISVTIDGSDCAIGSYAFSSCTNLRSISLSGVTSLSTYAFSHSGLENVALEEGIKLIDDYAFSSCKQLKAISFPDSVTSYGDYLIEGCLALEGLTVGGGCNAMTLKTFYVGNNSALRKLTIREGVTKIPDHAFENYHSKGYTYYFPSLTTISLPESLTTIGAQAFYRSGVTSLTLSGNITSIGQKAFSGCGNLVSVTIDGSDCAIGSYAFSSCTNLRSISLSGVTSLNTYAFSYSGLENVALEEGIKLIDDYAFSSCKQLKAISFPDSVTSYGDYLIEGCLALEELTVGGSCNAMTLKTFYVGNNAALRKLTIREGVTKIPDHAFANHYAGTGRDYGFPNLTTVSLPESLTSIGDRNLSSWPAVTTLRLGKNITSISRTASHRWMTLVTDAYHEYVAGYAEKAGAQYMAMDPPEYPYHIVTFLSPMSGVHPDEVTQEDGTVLVGSVSTQYLSSYEPPAISTPAGYTFDGWYKDDAYTLAWLPGDPMGLADVTLHARFIPQREATFMVLVPAGSTLSPMTDSDPDLPQGFVAYAQTLQDVGKPIILPDEPVLNGYLFTGWYQDAALTIPFTGDATQEDGITLYGGFRPVSMGAVYQQSGDGLVISDYHLLESDSAALLLPAQMDGRPVRGIANNAFDACLIASLTLPASLTFVEPHAFTGCDTLSAIIVAPDNEVFTSQQGVLYSKDMTILYRYPAGKSSLSFSIPSTVTTIAPYAFENCGGLRSITIPSSVTMIDEGAFSGCFSLRSVTLPDSVLVLGDRAFDDCSGLASFTASGLVSIGTDALPENTFLGVYGPIASGVLRQYCQESGFLRTRYNAYYLRILLDGKDAALLLCEAGLPIPEDATYGETDDGSLVTSLYRDEGFTLLWDAETELMPASDLTLYTTGTPLFASEPITLTTADGESVTGVILTAYHGRGGDVVLPRQVNGQPVIAIGGEFLASAHGDVNSVDIGSGVIRIADTAMETGSGYVFEGDIYADTGSYAAQWAAEMGYYCSGSLYTLHFDTMGGASVSARQATAGTAIRLPVPVRTGSDFLLWCTDEALTAPAPLTEDGLYIMPAGSLTLFAAWEKKEDIYCPYEYVEKNGTVTITAYTGTATSETLPDAINGLPVTAIASGAFSSTELQSVTLPESIVSIGSGAFARSGLQHIAILGPASIGDQAFLNCTSLTEVSLPAAVSIGAEAFMGCTELSGVTLPDSLKKLGASAFRNCASLTQAHIGNGLETIGPRAFSGCRSLSGFTVTEGGEYQAVDGLLCSADGLTLLCCPGGLNGSVTIPEGTMFIAAYAFEHCAGLTGVTFPASLAGIGESAFACCTALPSVTLSFTADAFGDAEIPASAFMGCSALQHVRLGEGVTRIGEAAFMNCSQLEEIAIGAQVTFIGVRAFAGADQDMTIVGYADSAAHTYALAEHINFRFAEGANVESITLPESASVVMGAQLLPEVSVFPAEAADNTTLTWHVADESICVFTSGALLGLKRGTTTVTVAAQNGITATTTITVTGVPAESVTLPEVTQELARGNTLQLTATILPEWAEAAPIAWTSSDAAIATVDEDGVVTAHSAGTVTIRATAASGRWGETTIRTFHAVEALESPDAIITLSTVGENATHPLTITALPADHTYGEVTFASSDTAVFQVDASGLITAVHPGEATVMITAVHTKGEEVTLTIPVTVEPFSLEALTLPGSGELTYTGEAQQPAPVLTLFDRTLVPDVDYVILTDEAIHVGEYAYTVQGMGDFAGEASGTFRIVQATPVMTYTGRTVYEPGDFGLQYTLDFPAEVTATFIAEDGSASADVPTQPGQYGLQLASTASDDLVSVSVTVPITIVESYVSNIRLSCTALTLEVGQTVTVVPTVALVEGAPDTVRFAWQTDSSAISAPEGTLTALTTGSAVLSYHRTDREGEALCVTVTIVEAGMLKTAALPASLTAIEAEAFLGVQGMQRVILPDGVTAIGPRAFQQTPALQQLLLPDGLTTLPEDLLAGSPCVILCRADTPTEACVMELQLPYALID